MRKTLLFLLALTVSHVLAQKQSSQVFDFSNPTALNPSITPADDNGGTVFVTGKNFQSGPISISFANGSEATGAKIMTVKRSGSATSYYLRIMNTTSMTVSSSNGATLDRMEISTQSTKGSFVKKDDSQPGEINGFAWTRKETESNVTKVTFWNNGATSSDFYQLTIYYTTPTDILHPTSDITEDAILPSFSEINLTFASDMNIANTEGITISDGSKTWDLSATANGNVVTLSTGEQIVADGVYTITVPAQCFKDTDGYENAALTYTFTVSVPRNTFEYESVTPALGRVDKLQSGIVLAYGSDIADFTNEVNLILKKDGTDYRSVSLQKTAGDDKSLEITFSVQNDITELGTYEITVPEKTIYNALKGTTSERYNPEFTLTWVISDEPLPDTETMTRAKALLQKTGIGYPSETSEARLLLKSKTEATPTASDEELVAAMTAFYNETEVNKPITGKFYNITSVAADGDKLYLSYMNDHVDLTSDASKATTFKATATEDGKTIFETSDGKYLHVLIADDNKYDKTSSRNVTDSYDKAINDLTFDKFVASGNIDIENVFGLFSMYGSLGNDNVSNAEKAAYGLVDHSGNVVRTSPEYDDLYFGSSLTSAFQLTEAVAPVELECTLTPTIAESGNDVLQLVFTSDEAVTLVNATSPYFMTSDGNKAGTATISVAANDGKQFTVSLPGLQDGTYSLIIPEGTFTTKNEGIDVNVKNITKTVIVDSSTADVFNTTYYPYIYNDQNGYVKDTYLNTWTIYFNSPVFVDMTKSVRIVRYSNVKDVISSGHFEHTTITEQPNVYALQLVLDNPITEGSLRADKYTIMLESGTFGDSNFGKWLEDRSSIKKSECNVNPDLTFTYDINNGLATSIDDINIKSDAKTLIFDMFGRRVQSMGRPGIYIVNGKKVVKK